LSGVASIVEPFGAGQREGLVVGLDVFDHRRLLLAGDQVDDALLGGEGRHGARVVVGDAAVQRQMELLAGRQGDPARVDLQDLDGLVEAGVQHSGEVERRVDGRHDRVERDQLLVAALHLVGELAGRAGVVGEPAARAGAQGDLAARTKDERITLATVPDVYAVTVEIGLVGVEELAVHQRAYSSIGSRRPRPQSLRRRCGGAAIRGFSGNAADGAGSRRR
jgi:hypothetical protein